MNYQVESTVINGLKDLKSLAEVQTALTFIEQDEAHTIEEQKELCLIEAPTFQEATRAKAVGEKLKELGLTEVQIDAHGNVFGYRRGKGNGPLVVIEGHLDTVFPMGSAKEIIEKDGKIYCPGICDDTRGVAAVLGVLRGLNHANITTESDLIFMGTAAEEGMGGLSGMKYFLKDHPEVGACICVDGSDADKITFEATGIRTLAANFHGIGGHAYGAYGEVANPLHAAARAIAKIADFRLPADPKTTLAFSNFHAGNDAGIHAIVDTATVKFNFRSNGVEELKELEARIKQAIKEGAEEETAFWGKDTITYDFIDYVDVPAGKQPQDAKIVQATYQILTELGMEPIFCQGGSTNANNPISMGIPGVCLGAGGRSGGIHTLGEWYDPTDSYKGVQLIATLALIIGGVDGKFSSILA